MKNAVTGAGQKALRTLNGFTTGQKTMTALAMVALIVGGSLFYTWASTPTYAPLFSNLSGTDASAIVDKLNADGTPYQLTDGGSTITVPQEAVYGERVKMSGAGLPSGDQTGYALLDKQGLTTSQFQQQVNYQRAVEGELEKTINAIQGVRSAVVHLAIPQQSVFTNDKTKPTASVLIATQPGAALTSEQVQAVTNLVSASIPGMSASDVSISDSTGRVLSSVGGAGGGVNGSGDQRAQMTADYESRLTIQLQDMVDRLVGPGHAVVQVTADLDYDQTQTTTEKFTTQSSVPPLADSSVKESYSAPPGTTTGILGPSGVPNTGAGTGSSYVKESLTRNNAVGRTVEQRTSAPGSVRKLNVGILLDSSGTKIDSAALTTLVSSSVGIDPTRGDTVQVTSLAFDQATQKAATAELQQASSAASQAGLMGLVKSVVLGLIVLMVMVLGFLSMRARSKPLLTDEDRLSIEALQRELEQPEPVRSPGRMNGTLGPWTGTGGVPTGTRQATVRDEIGHLVERQPDEVAELLRGWLADRRN